MIRRIAVLTLLVTSLHAFAQAKPSFQIPTGSGGAGPKPNLACSDDRQPSGFTGCEELRLQNYQQQLNQLQQIMAPIEKKAQEFIDAVVASHPGEQYVTAQMQPGPQAQQQFTQQFPLGAIRPKPVAVPPAAPKGLATPPQTPIPAAAPTSKPAEK